MIARPTMWDLPIIHPWTTWSTQLQPELVVLANLQKYRLPSLVALFGHSQAGPLGRYGVVGIPTKVQTQERGTPDAASLFTPNSSSGIKVVALGYESGFPWVSLAEQRPPRGQPLSIEMTLETLLVVDHTRKEYAILGTSRADAKILLESLDASSIVQSQACRVAMNPVIADELHMDRIQRVQAHIQRGDIYQANITRRLRIDGEFNATDLVTGLTTRNPVAHGAYLRHEQFEMISNTMETLLSYDSKSRLARSFPIKGTRERLENLDRELAADPKERAEHVMIVDLVRNDLGRVSQAGSVQVPKLMEILGYQGVWHGVSMITAKLAQDRQPHELIPCLFPGGSITGAPKRRAMEIIRDIEDEPRGLYTGSLALITPDGGISMSILIRSLVRDFEGWSLNVGGGIVADSIPSREVIETREKIGIFKSVFAELRNV